MSQPGHATSGRDYADRLTALQTARWKRALRVQTVYAWHLRRLDLGFTLDVGCGIGRNLEHLRGLAVGVDSNRHCVDRARSRGLVAFEPDAFAKSEYARDAHFDSLLFAHVLEHMTEEDATALVGAYARFVRVGGRLIVLGPQEAGFRSDDTHVQFMDFLRVSRIAVDSGFTPTRTYSFPLPRWAGAYFRYNEFVLCAIRRPPRIPEP